VPETIKIEILGRPITLKSEAPPGRIESITRLVDDQIKEIRQALPAISPLEVAIMAALNLAYEYVEIKEDYQQLQREVETKSQHLIKLIEMRSSLPLRCS